MMSKERSRLAPIGSWIVVFSVAAQFAQFTLDQMRRQTSGFGAMTVLRFSHREHRSRLPGGVLGLVLAFKLFGGFRLGLLAIEWRWRALCWAVAAAAVLGPGSILWLDPETWRRSVWIRVILLAGDVLASADDRYQSAQLAHGPVSFLACPKLFGVWILGGFCVFGCGEASNSPARLTEQSVDLSAANLDGSRVCASG